MLRFVPQIPCGSGRSGRRRLALVPMLGALALAALVAMPAAAHPRAGGGATRYQASAAPLTVRTAIEAVRGHREMVLTTAAYRTLYYFTADTPTKSACTGACASLWPPDRSAASSVTTPAAVRGRFTFLRDPNGRQLEYNGHLLYTYSGDTGPRQDRGEGKFGKWFVATPGLKAAAATKKTTGGGGGGW